MVVPAVLLLLATPSQADTSLWSEMAVPSAVFRAAGIPESREPTASLLTLIRLLHGGRESKEAERLMEAVEAALGNGDTSDVTVALPIPVSAFEAMLPRDGAAKALFPAFIRDRRASLFYHGAMAMDAETRGFLATNVELTRDLIEDSAAPVAAFGRSIRVRGGRVVVPGGDAAAPVWEDLVGAPVKEAPEFIRRLLSVRSGRTAYAFDTIANLDPPHQRFAVSQLADLHRAFTGIDGDWSIDAAPFSRPMHDASLLLRLLPVDEKGAVAGGMWRALWNAAFSSDEIPRNPRRAFRKVAREPLIDAQWLADSLALTPPRTRRQRYEQFAFGVRRFASADAASAPDIVVALRAFDRYPAVMLTLERMGVTNAATYGVAARRAQAIADVGNDGRRLTTITQFQSALAILDRAARSGRLDRAAVEKLVLSLCSVATDGDRYAGRMAAWLDATLLPALVAKDAPASSTEAIVLTAMADRSPETDGRRFDLEGLSYIVNYTAGEVTRFQQVRAKQRGNRLDDVLTIARAVRSIEAESKTLEQLPAGNRVDGLVRALVPMRDWFGLAGSAPGIDGADLGDVVDYALAEVLLGIVYAPHQGDPAELFAAAADLYHRHDFGVTTVVVDKVRQRTPWVRARIEDTVGLQMRVTGSLLGLDLALARFAVRRLVLDRMPEAPRLNLGDREVFMATAAMINPRALTERDLNGIAAALQRGRARIGAARSDAPALDTLANEAGVSAVRRQLLSWIAPRKPGLAEGLFSMTEILALGGSRVGDAWGVADEPMTGCYCLRFPDGAAWEDFAGRPGTGHIAARVPDLTIRLAEIFVEIDAPSALFPGVLAYATQDFIDEAPSMHTDDWDALVRQAHALDRVRVEDYLAAVAANGPLRPAGKS
jgi:hypothetical protein